MSKKKIKHYKTPTVVRNDELDLDPRKKYSELGWQLQNDVEYYNELDNRTKLDPIARKIVSQMAEDATRNGFRVMIPDNPNLQEQIQIKLDNLRLQKELTQQVRYYFGHGDGYLTIGIKELHPTSTDTPIDPENVLDVAFVHAFGQNHIKAYQSNDDPTSVDYGKEQAIVVQPQQPGYTVDRDGQQIPISKPTKSVVIDRSRYWHISLDKMEGDLHGTSIITRCDNQLKAMNIAITTVGKMLREFTFKIVKSDAMMSETDAKFKRDRDAMSQSLNTEATAFIGSSDDIVKLSTPTNGINTLLDFAWQDLAAACNIPKSVLTGEQAGTLAGATQDVLNYYDRVRALQEQMLKPEIEGIVRIVMQSQDIAGGAVDPDSINWKIEFNPLWTPDAKTQKEAEYLGMQTAALGVNSGIYGPDEMRQKLDGEGNSQLQGFQNTTNDSADDIESRYTQDQIDQYYKDLEKAHPDG